MVPRVQANKTSAKTVVIFCFFCIVHLALNATNRSKSANLFTTSYNNFSSSTNGYSLGIGGRMYHGCPAVASCEMGLFFWFRSPKRGSMHLPVLSNPILLLLSAESVIFHLKPGKHIAAIIGLR